MDGDQIKEFRALGGYSPKGLERHARLGFGRVCLTLLRSVQFVFKVLSHSASLRSIVIVLKVVAGKTNWREKIYGIRV